MAELLRSVWDEPRPPRPPARVWRDWVLVGLLMPTAIVEGFLRPGLPWRAFVVIITVGLIPLLVWRRTRPLLVVGIGFGVCGVASVVVGGDLSLNTLAFMLLLPYALYRWGSGREAVLGSLIILAKLGASVAQGYLSLTNTLVGLVVLSAAVALGAALRYRARARMRELDQVKLLERERLARDLHDTVAHHVSAIAIRAQAGLATLGAQPDAAADALRVIESEASRALAEMRAMVRFLRRDELDRLDQRSGDNHLDDGAADRAPTPRIVDLDQLAGQARPGPVVEVQLEGDLDAVPPSVGTAIYRLIQESVTNARRHARHATRIEVRVAADDTSVRLRVSDDGDTSLVRPAASSGYGLIGMIERADLLGGTCEAGPDPDRGWTVSAVLPRTAA